jgi:hypothetical protein
MVWLGKQCLIGESCATSSSSGPSKFATIAADLWKAFMSADIPHFKINSPEVRNFLEKVYTDRSPDESYLRKKTVYPSAVKKHF